VFDTSCPGRVFETRSLSKTKRSRVGQRGIISCLAFTPDATGVYVAGSYAGSIGVYDDRAPREALMELTGQEGGVTCVKISPDSRLLFSGARKDPLIYCWDLRKTGEVRGD
jgi:WD40 repeat protein